jgi:hypothetical protein
MAQQTALQLLLLKSVDLEIGKYLPSDVLNELQKAYFEAKEMEKEQRKNDITNYNIKVTEFLLNPLFNLEHSNHGIACEKLADIRNEFIKNQ